MPLPPQMLVISTDTLLVRWHPHRDEIREKPLPSAALLNSAIPRSEWRPGLNGDLEAPWKLNYEIRLIDPVGGKLYTYCNSTFGARLCWDRLNEAVFITRTLRGNGVMPIVKLDKRPMPTKMGMQSRPHLEPIEYREPPERSGPSPLTPRPPSPQLPDAAPTAPAEATRAAPSAAPLQPAATTILESTKPVKPIPIEEFINDSLPPF
jgi:hypothetical protein